MTLIWWSKLAWLASEWLMFASLFQKDGKGWIVSHMKESKTIPMLYGSTDPDPR